MSNKRDVNMSNMDLSPIFSYCNNSGQALLLQYDTVKNFSAQAKCEFLYVLLVDSHSIQFKLERMHSAPMCSCEYKISSLVSSITPSTCQRFCYYVSNFAQVDEPTSMQRKPFTCLIRLSDTTQC